MTVGKRLKEERKRLGLTQEEMAVQLGLTRYAQLNFEKDINLPGGAYLLAALDRGVDVMYVLSGHRAQLDPMEVRLLSAFDAASDSARRVALAALEATEVEIQQTPQAVAVSKSKVGQVVSTTGNLNQNRMQIKLGGGKKKKMS